VAKIDPMLVVTPEATLSYPHLDKAQPGQKATDKAKFSGTLVFDPGADLKTLEAAVMAAGEEKWPGKFAEMVRIQAVRLPFRKDGEAKGYKPGSIFINVRSEQKPGVVYRHAGPDGKPAIVPDDKIREVAYPGERVRAQIRAFPYDNSGNKGVSFALNNVQIMGNGTAPRLDNRQAATDAFEADLNTVPASLQGLY
jgi:hypothetical protein